MKRKMLALTAAVLLLALISGCTTSGGENRDFGYAENIHAGPVPLETEGESDYFAETSLLNTDGEFEALSLKLWPSEPYFLQLGDRGQMFLGDTLGYVERLTESGEWEYVCDSIRVGSETYEGGNDKIMSLSWDGSSKYGKRDNTVRCCVPVLDQPGEYRVTLNFREVKERITELGRWWYSEDEVHSISFRFTVPEKSDKPFDLLYCCITEDSYGRQRLLMTIRMNGEAPAPYLQSGDDIVRREKDGLASYIVYDDGSWEEGTAVLRFTENEDGSGKQYDLTLHLPEADVTSPGADASPSLDER